MKFLFTIISLSLFSTSCIAQGNIQHQYTGYEINNNFKVIQNFITDYEVEDGGAVLDNKVSIYKLNENQCVIVAKVDGDSGGYGGEDILYFYDSNFLSGYSLNYSYTFLNNEGTKKLNKPNYMEVINNGENTISLRTDFIKYLKEFNKNTISKCRHH
ncbi:hypothetical protein ACG95N_10820 [Acinetobacter guillouiae]|uniref:hypothetical protein n=1 Tax=Acinetobacter guillouiae TaxID=106649 RepID=UPI003AF73C4C